jgi:DNA integrity scanning protein DisA with diadenylate cyclase activity
VNFFDILSKSKRGFEKGDMHIVITIESTPIVSLISNFHPKSIPMYFHVDSIREFRNYVQSWNFISIVIYFTSVREGKNKKGEKQLMIVDGKGFLP